MGWGGFYTGIQVAEHAGALCTVLGVVISFTGPEVLRQFAAPTFALLFALPVPGTLRQLIALPLQSIATTVTHATLELMGVAATKAGNVLIVNGEQIAVGEACNGMRMVFALTLVTYAFAFSVPLKPATRIVLLGLSPLVALVCNVIRLIPTAMMFGYGTSDSAQQFHDVSGWVMLPVALLLLIQVVRLMKWLELPVIRFRLTGK
jgi:exosortase